MLTKREILQTALSQSAVECSCAPEDFLRAENLVTESRGDPRARVYLKLPASLFLVSYGTNVVAAVRRELIPGMEDFLRKASPAIEHCFETPRIYQLNQLLEPFSERVCFMSSFFLPDLEALAAPDPNCGCGLRLLEPPDFADLYLPQWSNAILEKRRELDMLAVGAYEEGKLVGLAGCSADCADMWQIGVDVLPAFRRRGIAAAMTRTLAREILRRGKVPFYCAAWSNVKSTRNAHRSGFVPAWVEISARPDAAIEEALR